MFRKNINKKAIGVPRGSVLNVNRGVLESIKITNSLLVRSASVPSVNILFRDYKIATRNADVTESTIDSLLNTRL